MDMGECPHGLGLKAWCQVCNGKAAAFDKQLAQERASTIYLANRARARRDATWGAVKRGGWTRAV